MIRVTGDRSFLIFLDLDLVVFIVIVLLASKSCICPALCTLHSYTSLGQGIKSKTCANPPKPKLNSMI